MSETTLYIYQTDKNVTLEESIINCKEVLQDAVALLYSPDSCQFLKLNNQNFQDPNGQEKEANQLSDIFEARIFNPSCELRWLNQNCGSGKAVLLSESEQSLESFTALNPITCESLKQEYLLWGKKAKNQPNQEGWQTLSEARIGKLNIPLSEIIKDDQRVYLQTCEYISNQFDNYRNYAVIEERLVKLEVKK